MNIRMKMLRAVALAADEFYDDAKRLGTLAEPALKGKRAQVTGLESVANGSIKVSDVLDYLKLRTARQEQWQRGDLGRQLIAYIESNLRKRRDDLLKASEFASLDGIQRQEMYMMLIRAFIAQFAAQYEYACQEKEQNNEQRGNAR